MSLRPSDFTQGGLLDDMDVLFQSARWVEWDYNGNIDHPVLALLVVMEYEEAGKVETADQYYSAGDLSRFVPSEDGTHAVSVGGAKGMADSTNAAELIKSVIDQGFPEAQFGDGDVSTLDGLFCHINRVPQKKRGGRIAEKNQAGYDLTVAVVTKIHRMPWENETAPANRAAGGRPNGRPAAPGRPAPASRPTAGTVGRTATPIAAASPSNADDSGVSDLAAAVLQEILIGKNGTVQKSGIPPAAFKPISADQDRKANRAAILGCLTDDNWLYDNGEQYGWSFDGKAVTAS